MRSPSSREPYMQGRKSRPIEDGCILYRNCQNFKKQSSSPQRAEVMRNRKSPTAEQNCSTGARDCQKGLRDRGTFSRVLVGLILLLLLLRIKYSYCTEFFFPTELRVYSVPYGTAVRSLVVPCCNDAQADHGYVLRMDRRGGGVKPGTARCCSTCFLRCKAAWSSVYCR